MLTSFATENLHSETLDMISQVIGPEETRVLLQSLVASLPPAQASMGAAWKARDFQALARAAHRLAGGCGSLGAQQMQLALLRLEKAAQQEAAETCEAVLVQLPVLAAQLRQSVEEYGSTHVMAD